MTRERFDKLKELLPDSRIMGVASMYEGEAVQNVVENVNRDSREAKNLEKNGYVLIYPKIFLENGKEKNEYLNQNRPMIVDKVSKDPDLEMVHSIARYYNFDDLSYRMMAARDKNSIKFQADDNLKKIYDQIGIKYEDAENGDIIVRSDLKRKEIPKWKIAQIYENAKGKVKGTFSNLKNYFKGKETEKNIEQEVNER